MARRRVPRVVWAALACGLGGAATGAAVTFVEWWPPSRSTRAGVILGAAFVAWIVLGVTATVQGALGLRAIRLDEGARGRALAWVAVLLGGAALFLRGLPVGVIGWNRWREAHRDVSGLPTTRLIELLRSGDDESRYAAAQALEPQVMPEVAEAFIASLGDDSAAVRVMAAHALRRHGPLSPRAENRLIELLDDPMEGVVRSAAETLGMCGGHSGALPALGRLLFDPGRAGMAASGFRWRREGVQPLLIHALRGTDPVCLRVVWDELRRDAERHTLFAEDLALRLRHTLQSSPPGHRINAAWVIGYLPYQVDHILRPTMERLLEHADPGVRAAAAVRLLRGPAPAPPVAGKMRDALAPAAADPEMLVRGQPEAARGELLGLLPRLPVTIEVAHAVLDRAWAARQDRWVVLRAWGELGVRDTGARQRLIDALAAQRSTDVEGAVLALASVGPAAREATAPLLAKLEETMPVRRWRDDPLPLLVFALGRIGAAEATPHLIELLWGDRASLAAAHALERLGPAAAEAVPALAQVVAGVDSARPPGFHGASSPAVETEPGLLRRAALRALLAIDSEHPCVAESVRAAMQDSSSALRAEMLGELIAPPAAVRPVLEAVAANDPDPIVRGAAAAALARSRPGDTPR